MTEILIAASDQIVIPVHAVRRGDLGGLLQRRGARVRAQAALQAFTAAAGQVCLVGRADGAVERVLFGLGDAERPSPMLFRALAAKLPAGDYTLAPGLRNVAPLQIAVAWSLGQHAFDRYRPKPDRARPRLVTGPGVDLAVARRITHACALARDMIDAPANDMGPLQIETIAREIAEAYGATISVVAGEDLHDANYPAVHAVGRAAGPGRAPRMIELTWDGTGGEAGRPLIALVGKGVVFDTGGLDLKPSSGMRLMKKDMGGAAHALALGRMIMDAGLPVRLVLLVPAVENAVSGDAMRPGDIIGSRKGLSIEIGNTDAEGRLILADALARAAELEPDLTLDFATLTGAARAALGPQVVPFYTADDGLARGLEAAAARTFDPMWRMPLWPGYAEAVEGDISDLRNDPEAWAQAGSVTAALFLQRFAPQKGWAHFDIFGWNPKSRAGWPVGAEVQTIRAVYDELERRYR